VTQPVTVRNQGIRDRVRLGGAGRVWVLVAVITALVLILYAAVVRELTPGSYPIHIPWWTLAVFFYLAETFVAHVHFRREAHTLSLSELGLVLGLFLVSPPELLAAQLVGAAAALTISRRQRPLKLAFNLAEFALCTCLALIAFYGIAGGATHGLRAWAAALVAASLSSLLSVVLVAVAISLAERTPIQRPLPSVAAIALLTAFASVGLALAAVELARVNPWTLLLLLVPGAACGLAFWAYMAQRRQHEHLGALYESMRRIQQAPDFDTAVGELLQAVRQMFRADHAEIIFFSDYSAGEVLHGRVAGDGRAVVRSAALAPDETLLAVAVAESDTAIVLPRRRDPHRLDGLLAARGLRDAMVGALRGEKGVHGALMVANSVSDVSSFTSHDGKLFTTFAGHASVLLENDRLAQSLARLTELKEQLRHQAFHDALTGLPNRILFAEHVGAALLRAARGRNAIVLFLDLDDFKTVNDSLGHAAGDELIVAVASRLLELVRPADIPARLGGDEFGVLLEDLDMAEAERIAERVVEGLSRPFLLRGRQISVHASAGLAATTSSVRSADELLCNADVAMYSAKEAGKRRYAIYEPQMHSRVHARLELGDALERAVRAEEFGVHYQPIVSLGSGRIVGFEALLRWNRPRHGIVPPLDFLAIAEETGLISTINRVVLREACRQARAWQDEFPTEKLAVSVNLSPSDLQNPLLDFEIATVLRETGLAADRLIIEITESGAMRDPEAAVTTMRKLQELGVRLALDDFGTGHSSLSYLQELPIDLLKIAKPFIDRLGEDRAAASLAETIVRLAESLGMEVVAEGIEHLRQANELLALDCSLGQGFHFAEPLDSNAARAYLRGLNGVRSASEAA
jgi:diguanylate cyclase (GGDEF)-like protein